MERAPEDAGAGIWSHRNQLAVFAPARRTIRNKHPNYLGLPHPKAPVCSEFHVSVESLASLAVIELAPQIGEFNLGVTQSNLSIDHVN
jgi:hypothetical protein